MRKAQQHCPSRTQRARRVARSRIELRLQENDSNLIFDSGLLVHSFGVGIGKAKYKLLGAMRNRDGTRLLRLILAV